MEYVKGEKFKDRAEAAEWCMDNKPIYRSIGILDINSAAIATGRIREFWHQWHKAIKKPEPIEIEGVTYAAKYMNEGYKGFNYSVSLAVSKPLKTGCKAKLIIYPEGE